MPGYIFKLLIADKFFNKMCFSLLTSWIVLSAYCSQSFSNFKVTSWAIVFTDQSGIWVLIFSIILGEEKHNPDLIPGIAKNLVSDLRMIVLL